VSGVEVKHILKRVKVDNDDPTEPLCCVDEKIAFVVDNKPAIYIIPLFYFILS
tara:strand:- start:257 stop:415 length:159 start_codon:yes stop_codon:yes gene_type:complete